MGKLLVALIALSLGAQTTAQDAFLRWMDRIAQQELDAREKAIDAIHTVADAERRKIWVHARILEALGGLPSYNGPLHAKVTGSIQADGYVIEKVMTANLYRPTRPGRYPAVLLQSGHTQEGKSEPQLLAANLALKGFVALSFDPVGQGEREQTYDAQLKAPAAGWSVPAISRGRPTHASWARASHAILSLMRRDRSTTWSAGPMWIPTVWEPRVVPAEVHSET
jgi:hypothetical protein